MFQDSFKDVADTLEFSKPDLAKLIEVKVSSIRWDEQMPLVLRSRLQEFATICDLVGAFFEGDKRRTAMWFKVPNPLLGGSTPRELMRLGRAKKLRAIILAQKDGDEV